MTCAFFAGNSPWPLSNCTICAAGVVSVTLASGKLAHPATISRHVRVAIMNPECGNLSDRHSMLYRRHTAFMLVLAENLVLI